MTDDTRRLRALLEQIETSLDWIAKEAFIVDYAKIPRGAGGFGTVVEHSTAMHALLFVRVKARALEAAAVTPKGRQDKEENE